MPELSEVTGTAVAETVTETAGAVVVATVVPPKRTKLSGSTAAPAEKKPAKKKAAELTAKTEADNCEETKPDTFIRPPMEQIARDIEHLILSKKIGNHDIKKLQYKCGKIIFGLPGQGGKDFRVIALKARKKTKSVAGKSRCIYYFGINEDHNKILKEIPGTTTTKFGCCSVQSKKPVELILDKISYKESFDKNVDNVIATITKLIDITIEQKNTQYETMQETAKAKAATATEKADKKAKKEKTEATA